MGAACPAATIGRPGPPLQVNRADAGRKQKLLENYTLSGIARKSRQNGLTCMFEPADPLYTPGKDSTGIDNFSTACKCRGISLKVTAKSAFFDAAMSRKTQCVIVDVSSWSFSTSFLHASIASAKLPIPTQIEDHRINNTYTPRKRG